MRKTKAKEKKLLNKEKQKLQKELDKQTNIAMQLEEEFACFKKEQEASPISLIKVS